VFLLLHMLFRWRCISNMLLYIRLWSEKRSGEESQAQSALDPIFGELGYAEYVQILRLFNQNN
jgi:hypothetical protein